LNQDFRKTYKITKILAVPENKAVPNPANLMNLMKVVVQK